MNAQPSMAQASARDLRDVRRGVAEAGDAQVLAVVRMVDALEARGATDEVLAPVRPRLRAIQPARPLRFARLLFMPADPLIVAPLAWRAGTLFIPRQALMVVASALRPYLREASASCLTQVDGLIAQATTAQTGVVRHAGALLWPLAAGVLARLGADGPPASWAADWAAQGLPPDELAPLLQSLAGILGAALALHDHDHSGVRLLDSELTAMLAESEKLGPRAWSMMLSLLVVRVPQASAALLAAAQKNRKSRVLAEAAAETALAWLETETSAQVDAIPPSAVADLNRQVGLLETLADQFADTTQRRRLAHARATLLAGSLHRFETALQDRVTAPLLALPVEPQARDAALDSMEASARTLRAFDLEARRLGAGPKFDAMVHGADAMLRQVDGLSPMDRARLTEILAGPAAAVRLLAG